MMMKSRLAWLWLGIGALLSMGCGADSEGEKSTTKIINGTKDNPSMSDSAGAKAALGVRFSFSPSAFAEVNCSGFRYGNKTIITAAQCLDTQVPGWRKNNSPVYVQILSGTGTMFMPVELEKISVHPDYYPGCMEKLSCPNVAALSLPETFLTYQFLEKTEPANIDYRGGFPANDKPLLVAFGCALGNIFGCNEVGGFRDGSYTVAAAIEKDEETKFITGPGTFTEFYYRTKGRNPVTNRDYEIASGDSGGPLLVDVDGAKAAFNGQTAFWSVAGIALYTDEYKLFTKQPGNVRRRDANMILDFGHPKVSNWLKRTLPEIDALRNSQTDVKREVCSPFILDKNSEMVLALEPITKEKLGIDVPDAYVEDLNKVKSGVYRQAFASCSVLIMTKIVEIESNASFPDRDSWIMALESSLWMQFLAMQAYIRYQDEKDLGAWDEALAYLTDTQSLVRGIDYAGSMTPGIDKVRDLLVISFKVDLLGRPVDDFEQATTMALVLMPGVVKAGKPYAAKSYRYLDDLASTSNRYRAVKGVLGKSATRISNVYARVYLEVQAHISTALRIGAETLEDFRIFRRMVAESQALCNLIAVHVEPSLLQRWMDWVVPTAYADENKKVKCFLRVGQIADFLKKNKKAYSLEELSFDYPAFSAALISLAPPKGYTEPQLDSILKRIRALGEPDNFVHILTGDVVTDKFGGGGHTRAGYAYLKEKIGLNELPATEKVLIQKDRGNDVLVTFLSNLDANGKEVVAQAARSDIASFGISVLSKTLRKHFPKMDDDKIEKLFLDPIELRAFYFDKLNMEEIIPSSPAHFELRQAIDLAGLCVKPKKLEKLPGYDCLSIGKTVFPEKYTIENILQSIEDSLSNAFAFTKPGRYSGQAIKAAKDASGVWIVVVYKENDDPLLRQVITAYPFALQDDELVEAYFRIE